METNAAPTESFEEALARYMFAVQAVVNEYYKQYANLKPPTVDFSPGGTRYVRVFMQDSGTANRSVHTFVDTTNGDILKAGGWKAPAPKGVRGTIYTTDFAKYGVNHHGAIYLKPGRPAKPAQVNSDLDELAGDFARTTKVED